MFIQYLVLVVLGRYANQFTVCARAPERSELVRTAPILASVSVLDQYCCFHDVLELANALPQLPDIMCAGWK